MTLDESLLAQLPDWRPDGVRSSLTVSAGPGQAALALTADHNDLLACRVWELQLNRQQPVEDLEAWAERLASQITGLLEPLQRLEIDAEHQLAQLRSAVPGQQGGAVQYYEVLLKGSGEATLRRFQAVRDGSKKREQVPFVLTHEVLARLTRTLAS